VISINLNNIEELVCYNTSVRNALPEFKPLFDQWKFSKMTPGFKSLGQRLLLELLSKITPEHVSIIEDRIGQRIFLEKSPEWRSVRLLDFSLEEAENRLNELNPFAELAVHRDGERVYICFWK
jgi:hypothetical protein